MAFEAQAVDKQYLAVVRGWPDAAGTIDHPLARIVDAYAPGASGNVSTEDLVHALELMGYDTGIDLPALLAAAHRLPEVIGHDIPSQLAKAGPRLALHPAPADLDALRERALARSAV